MFNKYPEQKQSRTLLGALGAAFMALGIFLIAIDAVGGVLVTVMGGGLVLLAFFANEQKFTRVLRVLDWF
ncbi:hypothetical protein [Pseudomonas fluorescens]|uniref:Uncharacterized protein n=1 Tax=Pseudomonas fluorescens TaxID=294 RepID=A0A120FY24_PSEFL|nr:hypothetical protein [Pseudomonas fluorescens]KWV72416.1 hypothetical protein PFL603g_04109 [Pseudomonas fluorescens]